MLPSVLTNSNREFCDVIKVSYRLKVEAVVDGCHMNVKSVFPIVIGTVPLNLGQTFNGEAVKMPISDYKNDSAPLPPYYDFSNALPTTMLRKFVECEFFNFYLFFYFQVPPSFNEAVKMIHEKEPQFGWKFAPVPASEPLPAPAPLASTAPSAPAED